MSAVASVFRADGQPVIAQSNAPCVQVLVLVA